MTHAQPTIPPRHVRPPALPRPIYAAQPRWQPAATQSLPPASTRATAPKRRHRQLIRAQGPDEREQPKTQTRTVLSLPPPEKLGVLPAPSAGPVSNNKVNWHDVQRRLKKLGAAGFTMEKLASEMYRVTFSLPYPSSKRVRLFEVTALNRSAAVNLALRRAERWICK